MKVPETDLALLSSHKDHELVSAQCWKHTMPETERDGPFWETFPNMLRGAIPVDVGNRIPWHTHAASPQSSQTFCLSAFGPLIRNDSRNVFCRDLAERFSVGHEVREGDWQVFLEYSDRSLLNEMLGTPTQIDAFLVGPDSAITVESKLKVDAVEGLGCCSKFKDNTCRGHYGPESDTTHPHTWCVLEQWDGNRSPRLYWTIGRSFFKPVVFEKQHTGQKCFFRDSNYQLMRNVLSAAAYSRKTKKRFFGTLILCPRAFSEKITLQVKAFREQVLLPEFEHTVSLMHYEEYIARLRNAGNEDLVRTADFLELPLTAQAT